MPDMLAHYDVAAERADAPRAGPARAICWAPAPDAYAVGAQGPDFLFYVAASGPIGRGPQRPRLRWCISAERDDVFQQPASTLAAGSCPRTSGPSLYAFACGYAVHLCLDARGPPVDPVLDRRHLASTPDAASRRAPWRSGGTAFSRASIDVTLAARQRPAGFGVAHAAHVCCSMSRSRRPCVLATVRACAAATCTASPSTPPRRRAAFRDDGDSSTRTHDRPARRRSSRLLTLPGARDSTRSGSRWAVRRSTRDDPLPLVARRWHRQRRRLVPPVGGRTSREREAFEEISIGSCGDRRLPADDRSGCLRTARGGPAGRGRRPRPAERRALRRLSADRRHRPRARCAVRRPAG